MNVILILQINKNVTSGKPANHNRIHLVAGRYLLTVPITTNLINRSFSHNTFPNAWKMAEVIPIQKSGDYEDPANTRPVSLLPIVSKVCERSALSI